MKPYEQPTVPTHRVAEPTRGARRRTAREQNPCNGLRLRQKRLVTLILADVLQQVERTPDAAVHLRVSRQHKGSRLDPP